MLSLLISAVEHAFHHSYLFKSLAAPLFLAWLLSVGASAGDAEAQGGPGPRLPFAVAALRKRVVFDIKYCGQTRSKRIILDSVRR